MKENIKKLIDDKFAEILGRHEDDLNLKADIDRLLELKGQYDVVPTELELDVKDVVKRYPITDTWEIVRLKTAIAFHTPYYWAVAKPSMANNMQGGALFETLSWFCDYQDTRDEYSEEERKTNDTICLVIVNIMSNHIDVFSDTQYMMDLVDTILKNRNRVIDEAKEQVENAEDTIEDEIRNAEFEAQVRAGEKISEKMQAAARKRKLRNNEN